MSTKYDLDVSVLDWDTGDTLFYVHFMPVIGHIFHVTAGNYFTTEKWVPEAIEKWKNMNGKKYRVTETHTEVRNYDGKFVEVHSCNVEEIKD